MCTSMNALAQSWHYLWLPNWAPKKHSPQCTLAQNLNWSWCPYCKYPVKPKNPSAFQKRKLSLSSGTIEPFGECTKRLWASLEFNLKSGLMERNVCKNWIKTLNLQATTRTWTWNSKLMIWDIALCPNLPHMNVSLEILAQNISHH